MEEQNENAMENRQEQRKRTKREKKFDWRDVVEQLIMFWQNQPLLYNVNHPQYHLKEKRRNCINKIISELDDALVYPLPSYDDVLKKINALRTYYVAEKNKIEQSKASGAGINDVYKSKWYFFEQLSFLSDNITPRTTHSNLDNRNKRSESCAYQATNPPSSKASRKMETNKTNELIETAINVLNRPRTATPYSNRES